MCEFTEAEIEHTRRAVAYGLHFVGILRDVCGDEATEVIKMRIDGRTWQDIAGEMKSQTGGRYWTASRCASTEAKAYRTIASRIIPPSVELLKNQREK